MHKVSHITRPKWKVAQTPLASAEPTQKSKMKAVFTVVPEDDEIDQSQDANDDMKIDTDLGKSLLFIFFFVFLEFIIILLIHIFWV